MRRLQVGAKDVVAVHRSKHGDLAIDGRGSWRNRPVMTGEAQIAVGSHQRLRAPVFFRVAGVDAIALDGELLVPQWRSASEAIVRLVAIHAEIGAGAGDGRLASRTQVVR